MDVLRCALIGCGRVAGNHLEAIVHHPRAALAAVCDLVQERAKAYGEKYGVPAYTNYHDMLRREAVDVVHVITPSGMHATHVLDVIRRYCKHMIVEKPLALRLSDVDAMGQAACQAGIKLFPVYQNRYNKAVHAVRNAVQNGALGRLALCSVRLHWCRPQRYYDLSPWRGTWSMDGGALTNQGIHYLDALLYLAGDVDHVFASTATELVSVEVEDTGVATLRFANGAIGTVEMTTAARPDDIAASITLLGERGTCVVAGLAANKLQTWSVDPSLCEAASEEIPNAYGFGHKPFIADVVADLLDGVPHPISLAEGTRAIRFLNALYRSAEDRVPVKLADNLTSRNLGRYDAKLHALYTTPEPEAAKISA